MEKKKESWMDRIKKSISAAIMAGTILTPNAGMAYAKEQPLQQDNNTVEQENLAQMTELMDVFSNPHAAADQLMEEARRWDLNNEKKWDENSLDNIYNILNERKVIETTRETMDTQRINRQYTTEELQRVEDLTKDIEKAKQAGDTTYLKDLRTKLQQERDNLIDPKLVSKNSVNDIIRLNGLSRDLQEHDFSNMSSEETAKYVVRYERNIKDSRQILKLKRHLLTSNPEYQQYQKKLEEIQEAIKANHKPGVLSRVTPELRNLQKQEAIQQAHLQKLESRIELQATEITYSKDREEKTNTEQHSEREVRNDFLYDLREGVHIDSQVAVKKINQKEQKKITPEVEQEIG